MIAYTLIDPNRHRMRPSASHAPPVIGPVGRLAGEKVRMKISVVEPAQPNRSFGTGFAVLHYNPN
jgi:hypothetical protein